MIKTMKSNFAMVPEGEQILTVTTAKLVPSGKPQMVQFVFTHASGAKIPETFKFSSEKGMAILGKRCDIATGGTLPEGSDIDERDIPAMFMGKTFKAEVVHNLSGGKTYSNIKYLKSLVDGGGYVPDEENVPADDDL
jgi:hypothetical protein